MLIRFYDLGLGVFPSLNNNVKLLFDFIEITHKFHHINELPPLYGVERGIKGGEYLKHIHVIMAVYYYIYVPLCHINRFGTEFEKRKM
jgi:hypothetical protein